MRQAGLALGMAFAMMLIGNACAGAAWRLSEASLRELSAAFEGLRLDLEPVQPGQTAVVWKEKLQATGLMSERTVRWLRRAKFEVSYPPMDSQGKMVRVFYNVTFPDGRSFIANPAEKVIALPKRAEKHPVRE